MENPVGWASGDPFADPVALVIPAVAICTSDIALYTRYLRSVILRELLEGYVRTARAKGTSGRRVLFGHVMRNALQAPLSLTPTRLAALLGAQALVEHELNYPGLGNLFTAAILGDDWYTTIGTILVISVAVVLASLLADICLAALDPRVRLA